MSRYPSPWRTGFASSLHGISYLLLTLSESKVFSLGDGIFGSVAGEKCSVSHMLFWYFMMFLLGAGDTQVSLMTYVKAECRVADYTPEE